MSPWVAIRIIRNSTFLCRTENNLKPFHDKNQQETDNLFTDILTRV